MQNHVILLAEGTSGLWAAEGRFFLHSKYSRKIQIEIFTFSEPEVCGNIPLGCRLLICLSKQTLSSKNSRNERSYFFEPQVCDNIPLGCGWLPSGSCRECRSVPPPPFPIYFDRDEDILHHFLMFLKPLYFLLIIIVILLSLYYHYYHPGLRAKS